MRWPLPALLALSVSCQGDQQPDVCDEMCVSAAALYGGCLESWGLDWSAAGYDDEDAYLDACGTWSWEMRLLQDKALEEGDVSDDGALDRFCAENRDAFTAPDATCDDYTGVDWNTAPWEPVDTGG